MTASGPILVTFTASILLLYLLQRWITRHVQGIGMLLFDSYDAGMALLWFFLLPGIIIHELSHWLMARLMNLKTGRFHIWPQLKGKQIILGSVEVQRGNLLLDSLVGLAPFIGGSLCLLAIGYWTFDAGALGLAWEGQDWPRFLDLLLGAPAVPDSWIWLYLLVTISNAMMPSPTDRESWRPVLIYLVIVASALLFFGWWPSLPGELTRQLLDGLRTLSYAFGLSLIIDAVFALAVALTELVIGKVRGVKVVYK